VNTDRLLDALVTELRYAARAIECDDDAAFAESQRTVDRLILELRPQLTALAQSQSATAAGRLREALGAHERLAALVVGRRDRIAAELARVGRPDPVARAYEAVGQRVLDIVR
jgi:hypothetical protein